MKKTRREWLNELKPEHAKLAIENTREIRLNDHCRSLVEALAGAFAWCEAKQGFIFWDDMHEQLLNNTYHETV